MLLVASILQYRFTDKQFLIFLIGTSIVVRLSMVLFVDVPVIDDMKAMFESAKQIAIGNSVENVAQLPLLFMNQLLFVYLAIRYSHCSYLIFYFAQGLHFHLSYCSNGFGEECGRVASVFYALYIPNIFTSALLTSESLAIFLFYLACYIYFYI